jgi:hypothetical protein
VLPKKERRKEGGVGDLAQWKSACLASANPEFGPQHRKKKKKGRKEGMKEGRREGGRKEE